ncbi:MAG: ATP-binding cassette domain-containing protein [Armatimonadota bacterium]|nr:ATP-binding cassette domain-containing protein [Armatimonadota bacterium]MDR7450626.1 ATP-binding cassette domain-containing protein [Armatimonadota bacterium]MDR7466241.1 ATP-binding cassette domain-containing protein [Armatimonadota bacterium]MDR7492962.1 ATP-binding cassette domain-containing protein [Armatimonadota bacterium]MDR7498281.1 ATP-binding cassette domain-containing protein [Armatimonadota bacterium]
MSTPGGAELLRAVGVTKRFGDLVAVNGVTYALRENEVAGIVGSNGAGKTTLFNLLTGYHLPDEGTILFSGQDITRYPPEKRIELGLMRSFQLTSTFDNLTTTDNLVLAYFRARYRPSLLSMVLTPRRRYWDEAPIEEALQNFDLWDVRHRLVRHLSLGEKRRLEIAMAVLADPRVLLLDEPLAGLSEAEIKGVLGVLRRHIGRQTILIVEHKVSQIAGFVERLTVMHDGRIIADGAYAETLHHPEVRRSYWQIGAAPG